jgi:DNA-binding IclR family transcriptional regulator
VKRAKADKSEYVVRSVAKALDILAAFGYEHQELGVSELAQKLGLHKNNVFRLLATLETRGYVEQDKESGNYRLGLKTFEVGNVFLHHLGIRGQARPILEELVRRCNETAYLAVLDGAEVIYISMHETSHPVRVVTRVGRRLPAYCTASGKSQLAFESQDRLDETFHDYSFKRLTEHTITLYEDLLVHLRETACKGYAVDNEEWESGVKCVAAPVRDYTHRVVAAVVLSGPAPRFTSERIEGELAPLVKEAGAKVSQRLGYEVEIGAAA